MVGRASGEFAAQTVAGAVEAVEQAVDRRMIDLAAVLVGDADSAG